MTTYVAFVLADRDSGEIEAWGTCQAHDLDGQSVADNQVKVIGCGTRWTHYLGTGGLTEYTPEQQAAKAQPQAHCRWDNKLMRWVDVRPLSAQRAARWAAIKEARARAIDAPIDTPYGRLDACASSRAALAEAAAAVPVDWTTADNTVVMLDAGAISEVLRMVWQRTQSCHAIGRGLRARIDAASTVEALDAIAWPGDRG